MRIPWPWLKQAAPSADSGAEELNKPGFAEEAVPHLDVVYRFAVRLTSGDEDEAMDVVQETFLRAYRSWHTFKRGTNCRSWLFTICRNAFLRRREQIGRRKETPTSAIDADVEALASTAAFDETRAADPEHVFFDSIIDDEVVRAIDALPEEFREAVVLSDLEGLSYGEVAEALEVPLGTVKSRLYRGRRLLQEALFEYAVEMGYIVPGEKKL